MCLVYVPYICINVHTKRLTCHDKNECVWSGVMANLNYLFLWRFS